MIIQCEKCQTKFRLDDSRVTDKGVKVRCTKCKNVFTVRKEEPEAESFDPEEGLTGFSSPDVQDETTDATPEDRHSAEKPVSDISADSAPFGDAALHSASTDFSSFETSSFDASAISFEPDAVDITGTENGPGAAVEPAASVVRLIFLVLILATVMRSLFRPDNLLCQ